MFDRITCVAAVASASALLLDAQAQCVGQWLTVVPKGAISSQNVPIAAYGDALFAQQGLSNLRWFGDHWVTTTSDNSFVARTMGVVNGELYLGCTKSGLWLIRKWNGTGWTSQSPNPLTNSSSEVRVLTSYQDQLLVTGILINPTTNRNCVYQWDGLAWKNLSTDAFGGENAMTAAVVYHGDLYVYGPDFHLASGEVGGNVLRYDGTTWHKLGALGLQAAGSAPLAMCVYQDKLIIGSQVLQTADGASLGTLASWDGTTLSSIPVSSARIDSINVMKEYHGDLIIGGEFNSTFGVGANAIVRWNGTTFATMGQGFLPGVVSRFDVFQDDLFVSIGAGFLGAPTVFARWSDDPIAWVVQSPVSRPVNRDSAATFTATAASGYSAVKFQWKHDGVDVVNGAGGASPGGGTVSGASGTLPSPNTGAPTTLTINGIQTSDAGNYSIVFTTSTCGTSESAPAVITVNDCPSDLNGDQVVNDADFELFAAAYNRLLCTAPGMPAWCPADLNGDGLVEDTDFTFFVAAYNQIACD